MMRAVIADVAALPGHTVVTTLEAGLPAPPDCDVIRVATSADEDKTFQNLLSQVDAVLIIAPETDGILAARCRRVREAGVTCWNCSNDAVELCGDKLRLAQYLTEHGLPTIDTRLVDLAESPTNLDHSVVLKPRDGAGSNLTFLVRRQSDWDHAVAQFVEQHQRNKCVVQPYVYGRALSVGVNISLDGQRIDCLPIGEQRLSDDGRFHYRGGVIPASLSTAHAKAIQDLVLSVRNAIPGLTGFIGFDLILTTDGKPIVVEINPRLTTSYVGYRQLYAAPLPLGWINAQATIPMSNRAERVEFTVDLDME